MCEDSSAYERTAPSLRSNLVNTTAEMAIAPRMLQTALPGPPAGRGVRVFAFVRRDNFLPAAVALLHEQDRPRRHLDVAGRLPGVDVALRQLGLPDLIVTLGQVVEGDR